MNNIVNKKTRLKSVAASVPYELWEMMQHERKLSFLSCSKVIEQAIEMYCLNGGAVGYRKLKETKSKKN